LSRCEQDRTTLAGPKAATPIADRVSGCVIPCAGAVIKDERGPLLLIKCGHEPGAGLWSPRGGRTEPGQTGAGALVRDMLEETGLTVEPGRLPGRVRRSARTATPSTMRDYAATVTGGTPHPRR
jgi:8-oxo-dGTP diphosphatase